MAIPKKVINYLEKNKIKYEVVEHRTVYTAWDAAQTQHIKPQTVGKTLVIKYDRNTCLALLPANRNLDKNKFKKVLNSWLKKEEEKLAKKISFAKEAWMKKNILGKVGATPPFGQLLKLPLFMDSLLAKQKKILVNSGEYNYSLEIKTSQFLKMEEPVKGSFSQKK